MVEVTQEDRDTLDAATAEWRMGGSSVSLEILAAYRQASYQRGKLEGARLALEAAATVAPSKTPSGECETVGQWTRRTLREAIRALDPAKIVDLA